MLMREEPAFIQVRSSVMTDNRLCLPGLVSVSEEVLKTNKTHNVKNNLVAQTELKTIPANRQEHGEEGCNVIGC